MAAIYGSEAYSPYEIAQKVERVGLVKARAPFLQTLMLGVLAGGFIGLGGLFHTVLISDLDVPNTLLRVFGGVAFATGYVIAILAGAEVFTSNNLLAMTYAARKITLRELLRNWCIVLIANAIGAGGLAVLFVFSGLAKHGGGAVGEMAVLIAHTKAALPFHEAFVLGILGNLFVCIAVWMSLAGRSVTDTVIAVILPLTALGAIGLEHIVATMYFIPRGILLGMMHPELLPTGVAQLSWHGLWKNAIPVVLGNIVGGSVMVATVYHIIYRRCHGLIDVEETDHENE